MQSRLNIKEDFYLLFIEIQFRWIEFDWTSKDFDSFAIFHIGRWRWSIGSIRRKGIDIDFIIYMTKQYSQYSSSRRGKIGSSIGFLNSFPISVSSQYSSRINLSCVFLFFCVSLVQLCYYVYYRKYKILFLKTLTLRLELVDFQWRWSAGKIYKKVRVVKLVQQQGQPA